MLSFLAKKLDRLDRPTLPLGHGEASTNDKVRRKRGKGRARSRQPRRITLLATCRLPRSAVRRSGDNALAAGPRRFPPASRQRCVLPIAADFIWTEHSWSWRDSRADA